MDCQSHIVEIHISTFGPLLMVVVKNLIRDTAVAALILMHIYLHLLVATTTVSQLLGIVVIMTHTSSMTLYRMEQDVQLIAAMILLNLGSIVRLHKMTLKH